VSDVIYPITFMAADLKRP